MHCAVHCAGSMAEQERLFFALWPDEALRQQLAVYPPMLKGCGGRLVVQDNLHITLAFLGSVDGDTHRAVGLRWDASVPLDGVTPLQYTLLRDEGHNSRAIE